MELGSRSDSHLLQALQTVWQLSPLRGCWLRREEADSERTRIAPSLASIKESDWHYGIATLPNAKQVECGTYTVTDLDGCDWLSLCIPMGALGTAYDVAAFPFESAASNSWRQHLDKWLVGLGRDICRDISFRLALLGHDVAGETTSTAIAQSGIPKDRWFGILYPDPNAVAQPDIQWHPPTS